MKHPITGEMLSAGIGALSEDEQGILHLDVLKKSRDRLASQLDDYDREIADVETDPGKLPELRRRRGHKADELAAAAERFRTVQLGLLDSGAFERCRGKQFANDLRARLMGKKQ
jgi:hypothetical protein